MDIMITSFLMYKGSVWLIRRVLLVQQKLPTLPGQIFSGVRVTRSLVLSVCFVDRCLYFFFWPLCCLSFDFWILITSLVSSNSSWRYQREKTWFHSDRNLKCKFRITNTSDGFRNRHIVSIVKCSVYITKFYTFISKSLAKYSSYMKT